METKQDASLETIEQEAEPAMVLVQEARIWQDDGWTARVIKNEDGDGWAVAMYQDGEAEPALVGPWTMGRDKVNPKPLDTPAFQTLVKTAREVLRRHEQQLHAQLHREVTVNVAGETVTVTLDIIPDEDDPHAILAAVDAMGDELARKRVAPDFKLTRSVATGWIESGYQRF
ncbi:hypothetical protein E4K72_12630 [Oxalobacteraceae bacterium OM1]|nr:hypothetical protein E4K72_12630 [Oxalobacteraceae bacterium OM1]